MKTGKEAAPRKNHGQGKDERVADLEARLRKAEGALAEAAQAETRREAYLAGLKGLLKLSGEICAAGSLEELLPRVVDAGRGLAGARLAVGAYGYRSGRFTVRAISRAPDAPPFPDVDLFDGDGAGACMDLIGRNGSVRLTDEELKRHPLMRAFRGKAHEVPLRGLLGACFTDMSGAGRGFIIISDKNEGDFTREDEAFVSQLADFVSPGLQHVEARTEAEREVRRARDEVDRRVREETAELRRAYEALQAETTKSREAEEARVHLAAAIEEAAEGVAVISTMGVVQYVNPAFSRITGYEQGEVVGKNVGILGRVDPKTYASFMTTIMGGNTWSGRLSGKRKDGTAYEIEVVMSPVRDASGQIINYAALSRDVTEEIRLESQVRQAQKLEAIGTLAGGIAHDFNNLLAIIMGNTELVLDDLEHMEGPRKNLEHILKAAQRGRDLVKQILMFSRKTGHGRKPLALTPLLNETWKFLRSSLPSTIEMHADLRAGADSVLADSAEMQQILMNLATNSAYAMQESGGDLTMSLSTVFFGPADPLPVADMLPGRYVLLTVTDTGMGMTDVVRRRIFEPFFTTRKAGEGTGMGLAVVYGIVRAHGGAINVESTPGKGASFGVYLPLTGIAAADESAEDGQPLRGGHERILFVDDEEMLASAARMMLERLGYKATAVTSSTEAWRIFLGDPMRFDLVITDQTMPGMTGTMLAEKILRVRKDMPIILYTGHSDAVSPEKAKTLGIRAFSMKPVVRGELARTIRRVLDGEPA
jgi:PAS domain S-box-containing protein